MDLSKKLTQPETKGLGRRRSHRTQMEKTLPAGERDGMEGVRFQILLGRKDYAGAYKLAGSLSDAHPDNAGSAK